LLKKLELNFGLKSLTIIAKNSNGKSAIPFPKNGHTALSCFGIYIILQVKA
jgi:hypothetical protein